MHAEAPRERRTSEIAARCDRERESAAMREWAVMAMTAVAMLAAILVATFG